MGELCQRCQRPLEDCGADEHGYAKLILECREAELANVRAQLAATQALLERSRLLLLKTREALDLALADLAEVTTDEQATE